MFWQATCNSLLTIPQGMSEDRLVFADQPTSCMFPD